MDSPLSEADSVLKQAEQRPPLQVESTPGFVLQPPPQRTRPPLPLLAFPPLARPPFLLLLAWCFEDAVFVRLRLVGLLWQVGALLLVQSEADGEVFGSSRRLGVQGAAGGAQVDAKADPRQADTGATAASASTGGSDGKVTDLRRVDFVQKLLQPHATLKVLQRPAFVVHQLSVGHRPFSAKHHTQVSMNLDLFFHFSVFQIYNVHIHAPVCSLKCKTSAITCYKSTTSNKQQHLFFMPELYTKLSLSFFYVLRD